MKITFLVDSLGNPGGMERVLCTKVNYFVDDLGYEVTILVKQPLPKDLFFSFSKNVMIRSLGIKQSNRIKQFFIGDSKFKNEVLQFLNEKKQDFVIGLFGSELPFLFSLKDGSKKIQEFHFSKNYLVHLIDNIPNLKWRSIKRINAKWIQKRQRTYARKYDALILLTDQDKKLWGPSYNSYVIPNPISFKSKQKSNLKNKKIVAVGRLIAQKGFDDLIFAFSQIHREIDDWTLEIYGEGQDYQYLNSLIFQYSLENKVKITNPVKDISRVLIDASIFVFPSKYEGFGLVLTEAMECGLPVVAYDCECGPSEIVIDKEDGFLVPLGDINDLGEKIKQLGLQFELRKRLSDRAAINVKRFYAEEVMGQWKNFLESFKSKKL